MANTRIYRCPPPHQFPPDHECTQEQYLDIAARATNGALHELMSSSPHVLGLCHVVEQQFLSLIDAREDHVPPAAECTRSELLDLAAHAATNADCMDELVDNHEHIAAICTLACDQEQEIISLRLELDRARTLLADARDRQQCLTLDLEAAQAAGLAAARMADTAEMLRVAALADGNDLRRKHAAIAEENRTLRIQAGLNTLALTVTGHSAAELQAKWAAEDRGERERRTAYAYEEFGFSDETVIVSVETLGEVPPALEGAEAFL